MPFLVATLGADDSQFDTLMQVSELLAASICTLDCVDSLRLAEIFNSPVIVFACENGSGVLALQLLQELREPNLLTFIICGQSAPQIAVRAGQLGVKSILNNSLKATEIAAAVTPFMASEVKNSNWRHQRHKFLSSISNLSEHETFIMQLIAEGYPNKLIAKTLKVSQRTIEARRSKIFKKIDCNSVIELVRKLVAFTNPQAAKHMSVLETKS
jgi:DNA-binding NarL/FixJ family response regulator